MADTASLSPARAWIFQANPKYYDIDAALANLREISWSVNQYKQSISAGDAVFLWRSGPEAGIVATATVLAAPAATDASLRSIDRTIIVECKYTETLFQSRFGAEKLRSSHLYQLCAYLHNLEHNGGVDRVAEGILLYPAAGRALDLSYRLHGHWVRVCTLDLNLPWAEIEDQMLSLIRPQRG